MGYSLGDIPRRLSWRQLLAFVEHADPSTKIWQVFNPDGPPWTTAEHRLADVADLLRGFIWQHRSAHSKTPGRPPAPLPRPYTAQHLPAGDEQVGSRVRGVDLETMRKRLDDLHALDAAGRRTFRQSGRIT